MHIRKIMDLSLKIIQKPQLICGKLLIQIKRREKDLPIRKRYMRNVLYAISNLSVRSCKNVLIVSHKEEQMMITKNAQVAR